MAIKKEFHKICNRFDNVMSYIGVEYLETMCDTSAIYCNRNHYNITHGITLQWILDEAEYWLSCYYEPGHVRCDDKKYDRSTWLAETGRLKRLINAIKKYGNLNVCIEEN